MASRQLKSERVEIKSCVMYYRVCYPGRWNELLNIEIGNIYTIDVFM